MLRVNGVVQHYAWGDLDAIPDLLRLPPDGRPWAEWWLGTHPVAESTVDDGTPLSQVVGPLPFLLKVIAAGAPLSLQLHPDEATARAGFAAEEAAGIPLDAPRRLFRDPWAKPEVLCALEPFEVLCGFRPGARTREILRRIDHPAARRLELELGEHGLAVTARRLVGDDGGDAAAIAEACRADAGRTDPITAVVAELASRYPGDPAVGLALLLNHRRLAPGEAVFLGPGTLHAYLRGLGIELMGPSDNVLRAGFTTKHVDIAAVAANLDTAEMLEPVVAAMPVAAGIIEYPTPTPWRLRRVEVDGACNVDTDQPALVIVAAGDTDHLGRGQSAFLEAGSRHRFTGRATMFLAANAAH